MESCLKIFEGTFIDAVEYIKDIILRAKGEKMENTKAVDYAIFFFVSS